MNNNTLEETVSQLSQSITRIEQKLDMLVMKSLNRDDLIQLNTKNLINSED